MQRWFVGEFAYLLDKLKQTPDTSGGKLFDTSIVLVMNNMNTGGGHGTSNLPVFLAGSGGGYFKTGRYLRSGGAQTGFLAGVANAMGVPTGSGELANLRG
jgi:hypothetical protein